MNHGRCCRLLAGLALTLFAACRTAPPPPRLADADYPGRLLPPTALSHDVLWQQRVTAHWGENEQRGFDAAVQKQGDTLSVLGLSPMGSVGFAIRLRGEAIDLQNQTDLEMPFPPRFVLLDVQRTFFPWLDAAPGSLDGMRSAIVGDEQVTETWRDGRLQQRCFERIDGRPAGVITITYTWGTSGQLAPSHIDLDNGWLGYRLTIDTLVERLLPAAAAANDPTEPPARPLRQEN